MRGASLIEEERRGLTWEKVRYMRGSTASAVALARELGVSDTLIRRVRRRELWVDAPEPRNRASILAVCNVPPRRAMYLLGHTDPTLTLAAYQQALDMGSPAVQALETIMDATLAEAHEILGGRGAGQRVLVMNP